MDDELMLTQHTEGAAPDWEGTTICTESCLPDPDLLPDMEQESPAQEPAPETTTLCLSDLAPPEAGTHEQIVEALLFASDAPLSAARIADILGDSTPTQVRKHVQRLNEKYAAAGMTFQIEQIAKGFQMLTVPAYQPWLAQLNKQRSQTRLTGAALETLSIVAYKQPIIRADIEAVRGVACGEVLNRLREMGLIKIVGRAEVVGRPLLYGTTRRFLDVFGLSDIEDLPPMEALTLRRRSAAAEEPSDEDDGRIAATA